MANQSKLKYSKEQLTAAIEVYQRGGLSRRSVARQFGVPESTLRDHTG